MSEQRLVDANALKEHAFITYQNNGCELEEILVVPVGAIDNAPTVAERPQGEWKDYSDEGYVECPFCGSCTTCDDNKDELHYCWNCGAELR